MKKFLVLLKQKSSKPLCENLLHSHIKHLKKLNQKGYLLICGPFADDSGAVLAMQAPSYHDIKRMVQSDPFIQEGFYGGFTISEFYMANESNNYLMDHDQTISELNRKNKADI